MGVTAEGTICSNAPNGLVAARLAATGDPGDTATVRLHLPDRHPDGRWEAHSGVEPVVSRTGG
ncbi:hypothetical protein GCM10027186_18320 [Micromonospora schwarzwaldensis]